MKNLTYTICLLLSFVLSVGCNGTNQKKSKDENLQPSPNVYQNECFSVIYPEDYDCDDSGWLGSDSIQNEVYIYPKQSDGQDQNTFKPICWFRFVKSFFSIEWKNAKEAAELSKTMRAVENDENYIGILYEKDSLEIDGFPAYQVAYIWKENNDTIIQNQIITLLPESHTVFYFNANFYIDKFEAAQKIAGDVFSSIKINKGVYVVDR